MTTKQETVQERAREWKEAQWRLNSSGVNDVTQAFIAGEESGKRIALEQTATKITALETRIERLRWAINSIASAGTYSQLPLYCERILSEDNQAMNTEDDGRVVSNQADELTE